MGHNIIYPVKDFGYIKRPPQSGSWLTDRDVTKTPNHITPILEFLHRLMIHERILHGFLSYIISLSKLVNLLTSALLCHSLHIVLLGLLILSQSVALLSPPVLKLQTDLCFILLLFCETVFHLIFVMLLITSLLHLC